MVNLLRALAPLSLCALLAACATVSQAPTQALTVRAIANHREIGGVGCVLTNNAGRWFVTAPGRVTVRRSAGNLFVDCKRTNEEGEVIAGQDTFGSRANNTATIGNAVATAGLGYLLDKKTGAGWDYPDTLTVVMKPVPAAQGRQGDAQTNPREGAGTEVY